jgi:hypothetical protein
MTDLINSAPEIIRAIGDSPVRLAACILLFICVLISVVFSQIPTESRTSVIWGSMLLGLLLLLLLLFSIPTETFDSPSSDPTASSSNLIQRLGHFLWSVRPRVWWCPSEFGTLILMAFTFFLLIPLGCLLYLPVLFLQFGNGDYGVIQLSAVALVSVPILTLAIYLAGWGFSPWWCLISR